MALLSLLKQLDSGKELTKTGNADIDNQLFLYSQADTAGDRFYLAIKKHHEKIANYYLDLIPSQCFSHWVTIIYVYGLEKGDEWIQKACFSILYLVPKIDILTTYVKLRDLPNIINYVNLSTQELITHYSINVLMKELALSQDINIVKACMVLIDVGSLVAIIYFNYIKLESYNLQFIKDCIDDGIDDGIFSDMTLLNYIIIQSNKEWNPRAGILANFLRNTYQSNIELTQVLAAPGMTLPNNREIIKPMLIKIDYDQNTNLIHILDDNFSQKLLTSVIFFYNEILSLDPNLTFRGDLFSSYLYNCIMV